MKWEQFKLKRDIEADHNQNISYNDSDNDFDSDSN